MAGLSFSVTAFAGTRACLTPRRGRTPFRCDRLVELLQRVVALSRMTPSRCEKWMSGCWARADNACRHVTLFSLHAEPPMLSCYCGVLFSGRWQAIVCPGRSLAVAADSHLSVEFSVFETSPYDVLVEPLRQITRPWLPMPDRCLHAGLIAGVALPRGLRSVRGRSR
jgi:hypothetical protein